MLQRRLATFALTISTAATAGPATRAAPRTFRSVEAFSYLRAENDAMYTNCEADVRLGLWASRVDGLEFGVKCTGRSGISYDFAERQGPFDLEIQADGIVTQDGRSVGSFRDKVLQATLVSAFDERITVKLRLIGESDVKASWSVDSGDYANYDVWDTVPFHRVE